VAPGKLLIRYLPAAESDLIGIYSWIVKDSPARAVSFLERIDKRIGSLAVHPNLGRVPKHPKLQEAGYRVLMIESYLVFYVARQRDIEIHRLIHGSRSLDRIV
jgi:toxin ParE1/3/4